MSRSWEDHGTRVGLMAIPVVMTCLVAVRQVNVATDLDFVWLVIAGLVTVGYAGTAAVSTLLFPMFRDWHANAAIPALYGVSAAATAFVAWLVAMGSV